MSGVPSLTVQSNGVGVASGDNMNTWVQGGAFVASLRAFVGISQMTVYLIGTTTDGDGGQGMFVWNSSSTAADDGGVTTIAPNGLITGRWLRQSGALTAIAAVSNIAALRKLSTGASPVWVQGYSATGDGGEGMFVLGAPATDNGGTTIVSVGGTYYRETGDLAYSWRWFGAKGDGTTDDTVAVQGAVSASLFTYGPPGKYKLTATVDLQVGSMVEGGGPGATTVIIATANLAAFALVNTTLGGAEVKVTIQDMTISGAAAGTFGIFFILCEHTLVRNVRFAGLAINQYIDRGRWHTIRDCVSVGNAMFQSGQLKITSSTDVDYCFFPIIDNYQNNTGLFDPTVVPGNVSPAIFTRRTIEMRLTEANIDHGEAGTPCTHILIENDTQGAKINGGSSHGCTIGILSQPGTGPAVAPSYMDIISYDPDLFSVAGIDIAGTDAAASAFVKIIGGNITAPASAAVPCINLANVIGATISSVHCTDYSGSKNGTGIFLGDLVTTMITGCVLTNLNLGIGVTSANAANCYASNNAITGCTTNIVGTLSGNGNRFSGNIGINPPLGSTVIAPSVPASGTTITNDTGFDCMVYLSGGSSVQPALNGVSIGGSQGPLYLEANGFIELTYSGAPTWIWVGL